jgi:Glycosyltransferase sugar-binding region containing DXD motif
MQRDSGRPMRVRKRDGLPKYQPLETEKGEGDQAFSDKAILSPKVQNRGTFKTACFSCVKCIAGVFLGLIVLDFVYLQYQALTFRNPCQIAQSTKQILAASPRRIHDQLALPLPKIIHQQWKTDIIPPGDFSKYHLEWKKLFPEPEYVHMLWTDQSGRKLIEEHYPWFLDAFDGYSLNIQRADSMRYFILHHFGGLYADLDYEPFMNFWDALPNDRVSLIESPYKVNEQVQNSMMSSPAMDPFWNVTFEILKQRSKSHKVLSSTGPAAMDAAIIAAYPDPVHILPCENFHRIPLGTAGKNAPLITRFARTFMAYSPLVKNCGDWSRRDDCQFGLHHNSVSYMSNMGGNLFAILKNF